jgi:release factor glutamine methyltransferase
VTGIVARLRAAGCVFAEDEAAVIVSEARSPQQLEAMLTRRCGGEPLEYILGWVDFCGLKIVVEPGVFVPRRRTEFLVRRALDIVGDAPPWPVVVDLCCGAGALGAAIIAAVPEVELHAADIDPIAVECARRNLPGTGVYLGDLFEPLPPTLRGRVDIVVANVPYVPSEAVALMPPEARDYEPRSALDGGTDGLDMARRVAASAPRWLASGGHLLIETSERQAPVLAEIFSAAGLVARIVADDEIGATVVIGSSEAA